MAPRRPAVRAGQMVSAAYADARSVRAVADRLAARGQRVLETAHFTVCRGSGRTVLLHTFGETTVDEDVSTMVAEELGPPGILTSPAEYGDALFAIVASTCPDELVCADCGRLHLDHPGLWRHFCRNTLARLRPLAFWQRIPAARAGITAGMGRRALVPVGWTGLKT